MDIQYLSHSYVPSQISHLYGDNVHILNNPLSLSLLSKLCESETKQPEITRLLTELYKSLVYEVVAAEFPRIRVAIPTRMYPHSPQAVWEGDVLEKKMNTVVVALARAGLLPSQITYDFLNHILSPDHVRQDHLALARSIDGSGRVSGADLYASKIGGSVDGTIVLIPDPMGATGSTVGQVLNHYKQNGYGVPQKALAIHLIVTPEYLHFIKAHHPNVKVYAMRLDRGLSSKEVLQTMPGTHWEKERGLTDHQYIVPGAGGLGEILNNSFV